MREEHANTGYDMQKLLTENSRLRIESEEYRMLYETILKHATSLENDLEKKLREITFLSIMDTLTNVYNRRKFNECLLNEVETARRTGDPLSIIIYDIDNFKKVNDSLGHGYGDYVLTTTTMLIQQNLRETDIIARWGGDEFAILLPDVKLQDAVSIGEALRAKVAAYFREKKPLVTCSFGVTQFLKEDNTRTFLTRADNALYCAKRSGRDSVKAIKDDEKPV